MSDAVEKDIKEDVDPSEVAGNEYLLDEDNSSHKPSESEGQAKGEEEKAASDMEDRKEEDVDTHEKLPVQDEHPLEEGQGEVMDEDDYEETSVDDKSIKSVSMTPMDIHDMVSEALDFKLENFQAQLQQMMAVIKNASQPGKVRGKSEQEGEAEREEDGHKDDNKEMLTDTLQEGDSDKGKVHSAMEEDDTKELKEKDVPAYRKVTWENEEEKIKWEEYLSKVCSILDMVPADMVSDDTVKSSNENYVSYLPAEGIVKNSWQKVKNQPLKKLTPVSNKPKCSYHWTLDDMKSYGGNPMVNPEVVTHISKSQSSQENKNINLSNNFLPHNLSRLDYDILNTDGLFHDQVRIMSYASYFLAGLGKAVKGEKDVEEDMVHELLNNLGQCLTDACNNAVKGSVFATRSRRGLHLDAMKITNKRARSEIVNQPLSVELFSADCMPILEKHQVQSLDANSDVNKRQSGSGGGGSGGGRARGSGGGRLDANSDVNKRQSGSGGGHPRGGGGARVGGGGAAGSHRKSGGRNYYRGGTQVNNNMSPAGGGGRRRSGQGGPRASPGGRQAPDRNRGNANRDGRQNDGAKKGGIGNRNNYSGDRRGEQSTLSSGGDKRGNQSGLDWSRIFGGSSKSVLGINTPVVYPLTPSLGGGYYRPGNSSYVG